MSVYKLIVNSEMQEVKLRDQLPHDFEDVSVKKTMSRKPCYCHTPATHKPSCCHTLNCLAESIRMACIVVAFAGSKL